MSVCPAGEDVIGLYLTDKKAHLKETVRPLQAKAETIYVLKNSDAAEHVIKRFPQKRIKYVGNSLRASTIAGFLRGVKLNFQPNKSVGLNAVYHFTFTGDEQRQATIVVIYQQISDDEGHISKPDLHIIADAKTWLGFLKKERFIVWALLLGKIRLRGPLKLLIAFGKCFPG